MINQPLFNNQLKEVLGFLFQGRKITILRFIRHCGRAKVTWIYYSQGKFLRATFISFKELTRAFLLWLSTINLLETKLDERKAIGRANYMLLSVGDAVFHSKRKDNRLGVIVEKTLQNYLSIVWVDWGDSVPIPEMPWFIEVY
ncbi:MAG: hypothetical protein QNJ41_18625 [Xenococcaceae cyanobacterium MO_188.B32]|nr:hypothetical protein [Xenococcaceae cyanobacterium MO_188.B32]